MKTIRIDFTKYNPLPDGYILGSIGEHNATKLLITPTKSMLENENIDCYYIAFETGGKLIHSKRIEKADVLEVLVWKQLTEDKNLSLQLEACDRDDSMLEKSPMITGLCFLPSPCGEEIENVCEGTYAIFKGIEVLEASYGNATSIAIYGSLPGNLLKSSATLKTITLVDVKSLPFRAFENQSGLETVIGFENVTSIDTGIFGGCSSLKSIKLSDALININSQAFMNCKKLETLDIPPSVTTISEKAFENCYALKSVNLENVIYIGKRAFYGCEKLESVILTDKVSNIDDYAFYNCDILDLPELTVENKIGSYAFAQCWGITNLTISAKTVGTYAFGYCTSLESVRFNSDISLGSNCFYSCNKLTSFETDGALSVYPTSCFASCPQLVVSEIEATKSIGSYAFNNTGIVDVKIKCPHISNYAFQNCGKLERVVFDGVAELFDYAFYNCPNI